MTIPFILLWSGHALAVCESHLLSPAEIRERLGELGIEVDENAMITQASPETRAGKVLHALIQKHGVRISLDLKNPKAGAAYIPEQNQLQLGPQTIQVILGTEGRGFDGALLHEAHHARTFQGGSLARDIRRTRLDLPAGKTGAYRKYLFLQDVYPTGFIFDEIAAYKKDVLLRRSRLQKNDLVGLKNLVKFETFLKEFSLMTLEIVDLIENFLKENRNPTLTRKNGRITFSLAGSTGPLQWDRYDLTLPEEHRFDLSRPREVLEFYAWKLKELANDGLKTARPDPGPCDPCDVEEMAMPEITARFAEIGIAFGTDGVITAADDSTRASRVIRKVTKRYGVKVSIFHKGNGSGAYYYDANTITLGAKALADIFRSKGSRVPDVLLHEIHHLNTADHPSPEDQVRMAFIGYASDASDDQPHLQIPLIEEFYNNEFAADELLAYRKDLVRANSQRRRGIAINEDFFHKKYRVLKEFTQVSDELLKDIDDLLQSEKSPHVKTFGSEAVLTVSSRFQIRFQKNHTLDMERPRKTLRFYAAELKKHLRAARHVLKNIQTLP